MDRSANMRAIRSKGTKPEMFVRCFVHGLGYRYRLHAPIFRENRTWFSNAAKSNLRSRLLLAYAQAAKAESQLQA